MASDDIWILGIHMTKFGKHPDKDVVDLASEAAMAALKDGGVTMGDMGVLAAGNLMGASAPTAQMIQKQIGQTGIPAYNVSNACAACGGDAGFDDVEVARDGVLKAFTIVWSAAPGIPVPFVAGVVDCGGTSVRGNVVNVPADPEHVRLGMKVRLTTVPVGTDPAGTEAVGFGFEPAENVGNGAA